MEMQLGEVTVDVMLKDIKNVHLSVYPPTGRVRISAPKHMSMDTIRLFAIDKMGWIKSHQRKFREQPRESPREFLPRESHYVWGKRYLLKVVEQDAAPSVELGHRILTLRVRTGTSTAKREELVAAWYREQIRTAVPDLIAKWEPLMKVKVRRFYVQNMRTRWGSCTPSSSALRLNTELAKKPRECLEYVVVHEMLHFLEGSHGDRFRGLMSSMLPQWQGVRAHLNDLPIQ